MKYRNESEITLMVLVIMVIILMIIAGVSVYEGKDLIRDAKAQNIETNMYTIKTKSKVFAEDVAARTWTKDNSTDDTEREKIFQEEYKMVKTTVNNEYYNQLNNSINQDTNTAYEITNETLEKMGLNELKKDIEDGSKYIVVYDNQNFNNIDIIYTKGITYRNTKYYTLSSLETALGDE